MITGGRTVFPTFQGSRGTTVLQGLTHKDPNDSSCDALKEAFNDRIEGPDQIDQFGDLRSDIAQQYITSNSLSNNAKFLLSTNHQDESATNFITQQLRELKGQQ